MNNAITNVYNQITEHGGPLSADLLVKLLRASESLLGEDLSPDQMINKVFGGLEGEGAIPAYPNINLIPQRENAHFCPCQPLCVVNLEARKTWSSGTSAKMPAKLRPRLNILMVLTASHWFRCMSINKETLMLCASWNEEEFEMESLGLLRSYEAHGKKVFIVELTKNGPFLRYPYLS